MDNLSHALSEARQHTVGLFEESRILLHLATAQLETGDWDEARRTADKAVEVAQRQGAVIFECLARLIRARVRRTALGADDQVAADLQAALQLAQESGALTYETWVREELDGA
jgi:hypothetical protein